MKIFEDLSSLLLPLSCHMSKCPDNEKPASGPILDCLLENLWGLPSNKPITCKYQSTNVILIKGRNI